jgi:hypothetical protein
MIDLLKIEPIEAERIAYSEGFSMAAELFARIADLEAERDALQAELEDIPSERERDRDAQDLEQLKEFFYDCFKRLAGHYPGPSFSSEYDKSVIFDAIDKGEQTP